SAGWRVYRARVVPPRRVARDGGTLTLSAIAGRAELWIDGKRVATKADARTAPIAAPIAAGPGERTVVLIVRSDAGAASGITGSAAVSR
ncbi:hypothetical protein NY536_29415, partial [Enterobacter hormaechei]|nr:hypothetical protein [Enterobacter hormaechei]